MNGREILRLAAGSALVGLVSGREGRAASSPLQRVEHARRGIPSPIIKDVQVIATAPAGLRLVAVKVITDQDGLYGYGCATHQVE